MTVSLSQVSIHYLILLALRIQLLLSHGFEFTSCVPVGIVPPRTKSPTGESRSSSVGVSRNNDRVPIGTSRVCQPKHVNNIEMFI